MTEFDDVIRLLRENRPEATPLELDRIKQRARGQAARPSRRSQPMKSRFAILSMLVAGMVLSMTGASLAITSLNTGNDNASVAQYPTPTPTPTSTPPSGGGVSPESETPTPTPTGGVSPNEENNTPSTPSTPPTPKAPTQPLQQVEAAQSSNSLPFTGFAAIPVFIGGIALLTGGLILRRRTRDER